MPGEEQVFDVALDRATELLPPSENNESPPVSWDTDDVHNPPDAADEGQSAMEAQPQEDDVEPGALLGYFRIVFGPS